MEKWGRASERDDPILGNGHERGKGGREGGREVGREGGLPENGLIFGGKRESP